MKAKAGKALLFIPDISGFTKFVHNTEVKHSQHIISELLEMLIDSNELGLELVEIEGDALFYFKQGDLPTPDALIGQIKQMFINFHHHLKLYEQRRICQCGACTTAHNELKLKFVVHLGEIDFINVKGKVKPLGSSVIAVHRLLKNQIPLDEYALYSEDLITEVELYAGNIKKEKGTESYSEIGDVSYEYIPLETWSKDIPKLPEYVVDDQKVATPISKHIRVQRNVLDVYEILTNLKYRTKWNEELDGFEYDEKQMNQDGTEHTCVINGRNIHFISKKGPEDGKNWIYIEQTEDVPLTNKVSTYWLLSPSDDVTDIEVKVYMEPKNFFARLLLPLLKNRFGKNIEATLIRLQEFALRAKLTS